MNASPPADVSRRSPSGNTCRLSLGTFIVRAIPPLAMSTTSTVSPRPMKTWLPSAEKSASVPASAVKIRAPVARSQTETSFLATDEEPCPVGREQDRPAERDPDLVLALEIAGRDAPEPGDPIARDGDDVRPVR